jgi:RNA polymerase sigma-70 factor (ECF subfamily)
MTATTDPEVSAHVAEAFRRDSGKAIAVLVRQLGSIDDAEEAVQDAFVRALETWPRDGIPPSPAGWIITTARNRALDVVRRESSRDERHQGSFRMFGSAAAPDPGDAVATALDEAVEDDQLRLMFTCCHPALALDARVALTLRLIAGIETPDIARAFLVPEPTMAQRLTRAKKKIAAANIPYRVPSRAELPERLDSVLAVLYLVFNQGYSEARNDVPDLSREAIRLARALTDLLPGTSEPRGLLALMYLTEARRAARFTDDARIVLLADQDRSRWDAGLIAQGSAVAREALAAANPGPYTVQAAIAAVHSVARSVAETDWRRIVSLYDALFALQPTAVVELNRAIALAEVEGPERALQIVDGIPLERYHLWHATRGNLLDRLGRDADARAAYASALALAPGEAERAFLARKAASR